MPNSNPATATVPADVISRARAFERDTAASTATLRQATCSRSTTRREADDCSGRELAMSDVAPLLDTFAAAARHRETTQALRDAPRPVHVGVYTDARSRNRPYCVTVKLGSIVRVERFADERKRDVYAAQARTDVALLSEHVHEHAKER